MHILVTDVVTCPRCGPEFGLIVLADRLEDRRVIEGSLGCANCREEYPIRGGVADLRLRARAGAEPDPGPAPLADPERGYRLAALLGVTAPAGPVVVACADPGLVEEVQRHLPDVGVIGVSAVMPSRAAGQGMGWVLCDDALPFRSRSLGGVAIAHGDPVPLLDEALRGLGRGARLVIDPAVPEVGEGLRARGADVLLQQDGIAVASDPGAG